VKLIGIHHTTTPRSSCLGLGSLEDQKITKIRFFTLKRSRENSPKNTGMDGKELFRIAMSQDHNIKVVFRHKDTSSRRNHRRRRKDRSRSGSSRRRRRRRGEMIEKKPPVGQTFEDVVRDVLADHKLRAGFPRRVERHVDEIAKKGFLSDTLKDMTHLPFITIDNDNSMDLDQAMYIRRSSSPSSSTYEVLYALADGAFFARPGTPIFEEAVRRGGSSFYLPTLCIPMLPRRLSEDLMSLNANVIRRALVFTIRLDMDGNVISTDYVWAKIRSRWKGTYREAQLYYDGELDFRGKPYKETLDLLKIVGNLRRAIARNRDVVEYNRERGGLRVTKDPKTKKTILKSEFQKRLKSELYNEQISLLCNMEGAKILSTAANKNPLLIHPIFRTQHAPRESQVKTLEKVIGALVKSHHLDPSVWMWRRNRGEKLGSYLRRLHHHCGGKSAKFSNTRVPEWQWGVLRAIDRQAMMTNVGATFSAKASGHYALRAPSYARFSSPMREIVGCFVHKELYVV
jgi:ribonuclease R